jgi:WD40 repeat protein
MGYVLFFCVIVEDIPQVLLTFLVEDYFEENGEFNNYALVNVIASLYDTLIKLAEAFDERADIVETGIWCKESIWAHKKKVTCVIPIPIPEDECDDEVKSSQFGSSSSLLAVTAAAKFRRSSDRMHVVSNTRTHTRQTLLEEAREIVAETKLPQLRFLSCSKDQTVRLWDTSVNIVGHRRKKCLRTFRGHQGSVSCMAFVGNLPRDRPTVPKLQKDSMFFLTGGYDGTVKLWNTESEEYIQSFEISTNDTNNESTKVTCIAYFVAKRSQDQSPPSTLASVEHSAYLSQLKRDLFVSGYKSGKVRLWDVWSGKCLAVFEGHSEAIHSICAIKDATRFVSSSADGTAKLWSSMVDNNKNTSERPADLPSLFQTDSVDTTTKMSDRTFVGHAGAVLSVVCVSSLVILTGSEDRTARLWSVESGSCLRIFLGHTDAVSSVAVVDNVTFLTGSKDTTIKVWDGISASCIRTYTGHTGPVTSVSATLQSGAFISASEDLTVKLWIFTSVLPAVNSEDGGTLADILGIDEAMNCVTCDNNGDA